MVQSWSRTKIVESLLNLHQQGYVLRAEVIQEENSALHNALYYKGPDGKRKYFDSINDAREVVANTLHDLGDESGANEVRSLNQPIQSPTKYSPQKKAAIRRKAIAGLKARIDAGEDVSLRALRESDRTFANMLESYAGYREAFVALGLNANDYARVVKHSPHHYLGKLIRHIRRGDDLDRKHIEEIDGELVPRLTKHFSGYYDALGKAREWLIEKGRVELAERANPEFWKRRVREKRREKRNEQISEALANITVIDAELEYCDDIGPVEVAENLRGRELVEGLRSSGEWLTTQEIADRIGTTQINVSKYFPTKYPGQCVRYERGGTHMYFFHSSVLDNHKRKNNADTMPKDSISAVSRRLGVGYGKLRSIADNLNLGEFGERHKSFSRIDVETISSVLEREGNLLDELVDGLDPSNVYTLTELELMGVPTSPFYRMSRIGDIPVEEKNGMMAFSGESVRDYLATKYNSSFLSQGLRLITFLHPNLLSSTDFVQTLGIPRSSLLYRLNTLLGENPDACFRIRKSERRSRIIGTSELKPFLLNWGSRSGLQLLSMSDKVTRKSNKAETRRNVKEVDRLIHRGEKVNRKEQIEAFRVFSHLSDFLSQTVSVGDVSISRKDLARLYNYMVNHDYSLVEIGNQYHLDELGDLLDDAPLLSGVAESRKRLGFALYNSNTGLIGRAMGLVGLVSDVYPPLAQETLMRAVEKFDPDRGFQFSTYAITALKRNLLRGMSRKSASLDSPVGDEFTLMDVIQPSTHDEDSLSNEEFNSRINEMLKSLKPRHKEIILRRFGLKGRKRRTLQEIGDELGISKEGVRLREVEALKLLAEHPYADALKDYLENS